jgi:hypothetical protein
MPLVHRLANTGTLQTNTYFDEYTQGYWSNYLNGTTDYLSTPYNAATDLTTGNFTIEGWFYLNGTNPTYTPIINASLLGAGSIADLQYWIGAVGTSLNGQVYSGGSSYIISFPSVSILTWHHFALVRNGTAIDFYLDGVKNGTTQTVSGALNTNSFTTKIGMYKESTTFYYFNGYISNTRIVNGTAVYTANFTPPTTPLTAITNTSLLTCQSNYFKDNSSNNFTITVNGTVTSNTLTPFSKSPRFTANNIIGQLDEVTSKNTVTVLKTVFITSGTSYTIPSDFSSLVSIEAIGGGAGGGALSTSDFFGGGGGGAYAKTTSVTGLAASGSVSINIGAGGAARTSGGDTWFNTAANSAPSISTNGVLAKAGQTPTLTTPAGYTGGLGGTAAASVGSTKFSGGNGGSNLVTGQEGSAGCYPGGGAAAGPGGVGGAGGNTTAINGGGGGGGGAATLAGPGNAGSNGVANAGSTGGNNGSGVGGGVAGVNAASPGGAGSAGGGGGSGYGGLGTGGAGGAGNIYTQTSNSATAGPGGGGGGAWYNFTGGNAGAYGGGGGSGATSGSGGAGIIIFTYNAITNNFIGSTFRISNTGTLLINGPGQFDEYSIR